MSTLSVSALFGKGCRLAAEMIKWRKLQMRWAVQIPENWPTNTLPTWANFLVPFHLIFVCLKIFSFQLGISSNARSASTSVGLLANLLFPGWSAKTGTCQGGEGGTMGVGHTLGMPPLLLLLTAGSHKEPGFSIIPQKAVFPPAACSRHGKWVSPVNNVVRTPQCWIHAACFQHSNVQKCEIAELKKKIN